jgi:hypothetical protein
MENENQEPELQDTPTPEKKTRTRLKSPRTQLQITIQRMERLCQSSAIKAEKAADLLINMAGLQKVLLDLDVSEKHDTVLLENDRLRTESAAFKALGTPEEIESRLTESREETNRLLNRDRAASGQSAADTKELARQRENNTSLLASLKYALARVTEPLLAMRAFLALKDDAGPLLTALGHELTAWKQFGVMFSGRETCLEYLKVNRTKTGIERQITFCFQRLAVDGMDSSAVENFLTQDDVRIRREAQEEEALAYKAETMNGPRGVAGLNGAANMHPEWQQRPAVVPDVRRDVSGCAWGQEL